MKLTDKVPTSIFEMNEENLRQYAEDVFSTSTGEDEFARVVGGTVARMRKAARDGLTLDMTGSLYEAITLGLTVAELRNRYDD